MDAFRCTRCGKELPGSARFCRRCGVTAASPYGAYRDDAESDPAPPLPPPPPAFRASRAAILKPPAALPKPATKQGGWAWVVGVAIAVGAARFATNVSQKKVAPAPVVRPAPVMPKPVSPKTPSTPNKPAIPPPPPIGPWKGP